MRQRDECYPCLDSLLYLHRSRIPAISQQTAVSTAAFRVRSWLVPLALNFLDDKIACSSRLAGGGLSLGYCHMAATCSLYASLAGSSAPIQPATRRSHCSPRIRTLFA